MTMQEAELILEGGVVFKGRAPDWQREPFSGEVVFTTGMSGYPETLTDPSYAGQIVTFTYPLIGNYGVPDHKFWESRKIHARGVILSELSAFSSHYSAVQSLQEWLRVQNIPLIVGVDTRALTKTLREKGTLLGAIAPLGYRPGRFFDPSSTHLVAEVSCKEKKIYKKGNKRVLVVDCGIKESIIRNLMRYPLEIVRVPYNWDFSEDSFDALFLSNGPGDPSQCHSISHTLQRAFSMKKPIYGVCLGSQLLAHAAGAKTYKLKFGHRGHNQPCQDEETKRCYITSQNHGYAVDEKSLPDEWKVTFRNLNDGSVEGIAHKTLPFYAVQFHPEASPGPTDTQWFFDRFYEEVCST